MGHKRSPLEDVEMTGLPDASFWRNRSVFVTGHTGFKGGWLSHWLCDLGSKVHGYALEPPTEPNFFGETQLKNRLASSTIADVRDLKMLAKTLNDASPEIVIHMAAQSLVRESYENPVETFDINVMGTVNLLESLRSTPSVKAVLVITSDKCYENHEWVWPYREVDRLGGRDPYSASKAITELAVASYRDSFLSEGDVNVATARAGNVLGGGDWSKDRLVPDFFRAMESGKPLKVRSGGASRPWQHVLEPLAGYLTLTESLLTGGAEFTGPWNFGPDSDSHKPVSWVVEHLKSQKSEVLWEAVGPAGVHESQLLALDSSKARDRLGWRPRWGLETALAKTLDWHEAWVAGDDMSHVTAEQIRSYLGQ